jgi:hypothetical protein
MTEVLDYSGGFPAPAAIRSGGYVGVVRYIGTPGNPKNLTRTEAQAMLSAGIAVGLVYERTAGWMLAGADAGVRAAREALADAEHCGVGVRCVYLACDQDITTSGQMSAVEQCLDGAAQVLGRERVGVYGEADVIDACLGKEHATWGWQTRAWSRGRVSDRAHLLQLIGAVHPGGVECDRNTVLRSDWGQWPAPGDGPMEGEIMSDAQYEALNKKLDDMFRLLSVGDAPDSAVGPDGKRVDRGGHPFNLEAVRSVLATQAKQLDANAAAIGKLTTLVDSKTGVSPAELRDAVRDAVRDNVVSVDVQIHGQPAKPIGG